MKGLQVAPAELENIIRGIPGVMDVAVIGIPNERAGEVPRAYVVKKSEDLQELTIITIKTEFLSLNKPRKYFHLIYFAGHMSFSIFSISVFN